MGFFGDILKKVGLGDDEKPAPTVKRRTVMERAPEPEFETPKMPKPVFDEPIAAPEPEAAPVEAVDITALLEELASKNPQKLNWRTSIVDLLKLLEIDSSYGARKELARELECPDEIMKESAKMNMWLHKTVIARIAENGGKVPEDLLD